MTDAKEPMPIDSAEADLKRIKYASTITYVWGTMIVLAALSVAFPVAIGRATIVLPGILFISALFLVGVAFIVLGSKIRRAQKSAAGPLIVLYIVTAVVMLFLRFPVAPLGALLGLVVSIFLSKSRKALV